MMPRVLELAYRNTGGQLEGVDGQSVGQRSAIGHPQQGQSPALGNPEVCCQSLCMSKMSQLAQG